MSAQIIRFPMERRVAQIARALEQRSWATDLSGSEADPLSVHVESRRLMYGYDGTTKWEQTA